MITRRDVLLSGAATIYAAATPLHLATAASMPLFASDDWQVWEPADSKFPVVWDITASIADNPNGGFRKTVWGWWRDESEQKRLMLLAAKFDGEGEWKVKYSSGGERVNVIDHAITSPIWDAQRSIATAKRLFSERRIYAPLREWAEQVIDHTVRFPDAHDDGTTDSVLAGIAHCAAKGEL